MSVGLRGGGGGLKAILRGGKRAGETGPSNWFVTFLFD